MEFNSGFKGLKNTAQCSYKSADFIRHRFRITCQNSLYATLPGYLFAG